MKSLALCLTAASLLAADRSPEAAAWWSHVEYLASDALEGRRPGTPGYKKAAAYVASQFERAGLKPGASQTSYMQQVSMQTRLIDENKSSLEVISGSASRKVQLGQEANLGIRVDQPATVEAEVVFVGHGLKIPEAKIDDLAGLDLKGKIAFYLSGAPSNVSAPLAAHAQSVAERWRNLKAAGAIGTMSFADPRTSDIPWARSTLARLNPVIALTEPQLIDTAGIKISIVVNPQHADLFLAGTEHTSEKLLEIHRRNAPLPRFPLKAKIRAKTTFNVSPMVSENVVGILPGKSRETVVISAHLDHLGVGGTINGDGIYNGAMDNASGIASLIEIARTLSKRSLERTVAFVAVTGEEGGLMGSKHFAAHPTAPVKDIVADINLDMFLPIIPLKGLTVYGMDESDLGDEFASLAETFGVTANRDPQPARNLFIRSDQYSFVRRGVPSLAFKFHPTPGTSDQKTMAEWIARRYHAPTDDLQQPVELESAARFNQIMSAFIEQTANRTSRPKWKENSFFRRYGSAD
jgi:hypothetical protein